MAFETEYKQERSRVTLLLILAVCVAFAAVWAWVFFQQKPRVADGAIDSITVVPLHSVYHEGGPADEGVGGGDAVTDQLLVWVRFHMTNLTSRTPLYETQQTATLTALDGTEQTTDAQNTISVAQVRTMPNVQQVPGTLVPAVMTLAPGQSTQGLALFAFPITKQQWDKRRAFSVTIAFQMQHSLAMQDPHPAVSEMMPTIKK